MRHGRRGERTSNDEWAQLWREHQWEFFGFIVGYFAVMLSCFAIYDLSWPFLARFAACVPLVVVFTVAFSTWSGRRVRAMRE